MADIGIVAFGKHFGACREGVGRALALRHTTMAQVWADTRMDPSDRVWTATQKGVLTDRELRLLAVWCARQVQHLMTDPRSIAALDVAERYALGSATLDELDAARAAARAAAGPSEWATEAAAWAAAGAAEWAAAAATDAVGVAERDVQADYILANTLPDWQRAMEQEEGR